MKLNELDPEQRAEYEDLVNENRVLIQNINAQRNQLDDINGALGQAEARLRVFLWEELFNVHYEK